MKTESSPLKFPITFTICCAVLIVYLAGSSQSIMARYQTGQRGLKLQSSETVNKWPTSAKRYALIIGVDEYESAQINRLEGASNDAKSIAEALIQYAGFQRDQVTLLTADQPAQRRPTRNNILGRLSNLRSIVPQDGLLLVAFAGHGIQREGRAYLLPTDAQLTDDITLLEETAINVEVIRNWIRQAGIGQVVLIIDACRNNPTTGRGESGNPLTEAYTRALNFDVRNHEVSAFVTLYATEVGHVAYEYKEKKQGYFSWALVEGLKGAAANERGEVTLAGLRKYVEEEVSRRSLLDLGKGKQQRPFAVMEGYKADELLISATAPKVVPSVGSKESNTTLDSAAMKDLNAWNKIKNSNKLEDYYAYLKEYPSGAFVELAKSRVSNIETSAKPPSISNSAKTTDQYLNEGNRFFKEGKWTEAEAEYRQALQLSPGRSQCHYSLAAAFLKQEKWPQAEEEYKEALHLDPGESFLHAGLGFVLIQQQKWAAAESEYKTALSANPNQAVLHYNLAYIFLQQQKLNEAEAELKEAIRLDPPSAKEYGQMLDKVREAIENSKNAITAGSPDVRSKPVPDYYSNKQFLQAFSKARFLLEKPDNHQDAISEFRKAFKLSNDKCSECLYQIGQIYLELSKYSEAADAFRQCLSLNPENEALVTNMLGGALFRRGDKRSLEEATTAFRRSIELSDGHMSQNYLNLGRTLFKLGKEQEGLTAFKAYVEANPSSSNARQVRTIIANPQLANEDFAPSFRIRSHAGDELSSDNYEGKVVLLHFWRCGSAYDTKPDYHNSGDSGKPCREYLSDMKNILKKHGSNNFVMIGINYLDDIKTFEHAIQQEGVDWPQYFEIVGRPDLGGNKMSRLFSADFSIKVDGLEAIPVSYTFNHTILIDQAGIIRFVGIQGNKLSNAITELLKRTPFRRDPKLIQERK